MTDCVKRAIGLEQVDLSGKLIVIDEHHGSDANFLVNAVLSKSLEKGRGICMVLFHNTFGHYHNIGMKLGYNLNMLRECGRITVVEPMKSIFYSIEELGHDSVDPETTELEEKVRDSFDNTTMPCPLKLDENLVQYLFASLKDQYYKVKQVNENVTIIIDNITHLIDLNISLREIWFYIRYLRSLMDIEPKLSMCILGHSYQTDTNNCHSNMVVSVLRRSAHVHFCTEPLSTGHSSEISGLLSVVWKSVSLKKKYHWADRIVYLYKLLDRQIKLFTPGGTPLQL